MAQEVIAYKIESLLDNFEHLTPVEKIHLSQLLTLQVEIEKAEELPELQERDTELQSEVRRELLHSRDSENGETKQEGKAQENPKPTHETQTQNYYAVLDEGGDEMEGSDEGESEKGSTEEFEFRGKGRKGSDLYRGRSRRDSESSVHTPLIPLHEPQPQPNDGTLNFDPFEPNPEPPAQTKLTQMAHHYLYANRDDDDGDGDGQGHVVGRVRDAGFAGGVDRGYDRTLSPVDRDLELPERPKKRLHLTKGTTPLAPYGTPYLVRPPTPGRPELSKARPGSAFREARTPVISKAASSAPKFKGNAEEIQSWLWSFQVHCDLHNIREPSAQLRLALTCLQGPAREWAMLESDLSNRLIAFTDLDELMEKMTEHLTVGSVEKQARTSLQSLWQNEQSVSEYALRFQAQMRRIEDMSYTDRCHAFVRHLRPNLKAEILKHPDYITCDLTKAEGLKKVLATALAIEDLPGMRSNSARRPPSRTNTPANKFRKMSRDSSLTDDGDEFTPTNQGRARVRRLSAEEEKRYRSEGLCFICGQKGHRAPQCPKRMGKAKVPRTEHSA